MLSWFDAWRKKRTIANIRRHMAFFGHDLSAMTDEHLEVAIGHMAKRIAGAGVSTAEARDGLGFVRNAVKREVEV